MKISRQYYAYIFSVNQTSSSNQYFFRAKEYVFDLLGKSLSGGINNRTYYIGMGSTSYISPCLEAISDWNSLLSPSNGYGVNFNFSRVYLPTNATFNFWGENQPDEPWVGLTRFFDSSGNSLNNLNALPNYTTTNWSRASIIINSHFASNLTYNKKKSVFNHEIGHALGLAHVDPTNLIMRQGVFDRTVIIPKVGDLKGAEYIYS